MTESTRAIPALLLILGAVGAAPAPAQVVAGTTSSQVLHRVDAELPKGAEIQANYDVSCKVLFDVGTEGLPTAVSVSDCDSPFREAAEAAGRQWRFRPTVVDGRAIPYVYSARLTFQRTTGQGAVHQELDTSASSASSQIRVLNKVQPALPEELRRMARQAQVGAFECKVRIDVGADGVPVDAVVLDAPEFLVGPLREAALQWRFQPVVVEGEARPFNYMWTMSWQTL